ncbi:MAG: hypothetical protein RIR10_1566 [Planctomycetota bacterium]
MPRAGRAIFLRRQRHLARSNERREPTAARAIAAEAVEARSVGVGARWLRVDPRRRDAGALELQSHSMHEIGVVPWAVDSRCDDARREVDAREFVGNFGSDLKVLR